MSKNTKQTSSKVATLASETLLDKQASQIAKGRAEYNAKNGSNLNPPAPNPKTKADAGRKASFCARMEGVVKNAKGPAERAKASLKNWNC